MPFDSGDAVVCTYVRGDCGLTPLFVAPFLPPDEVERFSH